MGLFENFPYTNFHELNLDWILQMLKKIDKTMDEFVAINALKYADPIQWNITSQYEKNTIVIDPQSGTAYISVQPVPVGVALTNTDYWTVVFDLEQFVTKANGNFTLRVEPLTTLTATFATPVNGWVIWGGDLYKAITNITAGDQYVVDSNIKRFTVEDVVGYVEELKTTAKDNLVNAVNALFDSLTNIYNIIGDLDDLTTSDKTSIVNAINDVLVIVGRVIGDLNDLNTTDKTSIVNAVNEVLSNIGDLNNLTTTDKSSIVNALNEIMTILQSNVVINVLDRGVIADGSTDNTTALQTIINEAAGSNIIYFPAGTYITRNLTIPSNTHIILDGELKLADNTNNQLLVSNSTENIIIEGNGSLNGNKANQNSLIAIACILFGDASDPIYKVNNVLIKGITIKNSLYWGASVIGDNDSFIDVTFADNEYMSFIGPGSKNGLFKNCVAYGVTVDWGLGFYGGVDGGIIDGCTAYNNNQTGLGALSDADQPTPSNNIKIVNCTSYDNKMGIATGGWTGTGKNIIISGNHCYNSAAGSIYDYGGIFVSNTEDAVISDNIIKDNGDTNYAGIVLTGNNSLFDICNNIIDAGTGSYGLLMTGTTFDNINIKNNIIRSAVNSISYTGVTNCISNEITDNNLGSNPYIPFTGHSAVMVRDNSIYTMRVFYKEFTPDGVTSTFLFTAAEMDLLGDINNAVVTSARNYGDYTVSWSNTQVGVTYDTAPSSGYGVLKFSLVVTTSLY